VEIGRFNHLKVIKKTAFGIFLESDAGDILVPAKHVPEGTEPGDMLDVFVYTDSEDRIIATTQVPKALAGEFAFLRVKEVTPHGAFLDWGLDKDLLVPFSEQHTKMERGRNYLVKLFVHEETGRVTGSTKTEKFIEHENITLRGGEEVSILIIGLTGIGIRVIVNDRYFGLLYKNEVFQKLNIGDRVKGYVKRAREDGKIDVMLTKGGAESIEEAREAILQKLKESPKKFLPMGDSTSPEVIREILHMSKKAFKRAVGGLYKDELIELTTEGIRLKRVDKRKIVHKFKF
jgi:hypothetical protein